MRPLLLFLLLPSLAFSDPVEATHHVRIGPPVGGLVNGINRAMLPPNVISSGTNAGIRQSGGFGWIGDFVSTNSVNISNAFILPTTDFYADISDHISYVGIYRSNVSTGDIIIIFKTYN